MRSLCAIVAASLMAATLATHGETTFVNAAVLQNFDADSTASVLGVAGASTLMTTQGNKRRGGMSKDDANRGGGQKPMRMCAVGESPFCSDQNNKGGDDDERHGKSMKERMRDHARKRAERRREHRNKDDNKDEKEDKEEAEDDGEGEAKEENQVSNPADRRLLKRKDGESMKNRVRDRSKKRADDRKKRADKRRNNRKDRSDKRRDDRRDRADKRRDNRKDRRQGGSKGRGTIDGRRRCCDDGSGADGGGGSGGGGSGGGGNGNDSGGEIDNEAALGGATATEPAADSSEIGMYLGIAFACLAAFVLFIFCWHRQKKESSSFNQQTHMLQRTSLSVSADPYHAHEYTHSPASTIGMSGEV